MLEMAKGASVSVIALVLVVQVILQVMLPYVAKRKNGKDSEKPSRDPDEIKAAAILSHQVSEIDRRTQTMNDTMLELTQTCKESAAAIRDNTRAIEKLTDKI